MSDLAFFQHVRAVGTGKTAVASDEKHRGPRVVLVLRRQRVVDVRLAGDAETARVIASAYGVEAATRCCALIMRDAAISSKARVIFAVARTDLMRRR